MTDIQLLCELIIEYESNQNAAGEYDGHDPRLIYETSGNIGANDIIWLAKKVLRDNAS